MSLTFEHITQLQTTWRDLAREPEALTATFYAALFRIAPEVRPLFAGADLAAQQAKLAAAIGLVVKSVRNLETVVPVLTELGRRHVAYGVTDAHYDAVGQALIEAIATRLGSDFTPAAHEAWFTAYGIVAATMKAGAAPALKRSA